jgi:hypothetical protein
LSDRIPSKYVLNAGPEKRVQNQLC